MLELINFINNIKKDYEEYCRNKLKSEFTNYEELNQSPMFVYQRYKYRTISVKPRHVVESENFKIPIKYNSVYEKIVSDITSGLPLKHYQSRTLKDINFNDDMLSHWKIQHFHLGDTIDNDGFVNRTGDLLFIYFTADIAYMIGVYSHGAWSDLSIIEVIHKNWPDELIKFNSTEKSKSLTSQEYKQLRANGYNTTVTVSDGTEYFGPGFGVMSGHAPIETTIAVDRIIEQFRRDFELICLNFDQILDFDPNKASLKNIVTIGMEMNDELQKFVYKINETGHRFTLED